MLWPPLAGLRDHTQTPNSVGFLWMSDQTDAESLVLFQTYRETPEIKGTFPVNITLLGGDRGGTVVKVLRYKSEGRWFDSRWCHWNFSLT